ncbi:hypothetical protein ACWX3G_000807 [Escherichia coli]
MNDIKTAYSLGNEGMLITRYTDDANFHEVEIKDYHEVLKDMEAGAYDADLNLALQVVDIVMGASIRDYVSLSMEEKNIGSALCILSYFCEAHGGRIRTRTSAGRG